MLQNPESEVSRTYPRKVLITGGNGYVGSTLIKQLLALGAEVHAIANRNKDRLVRLLPATHIHEIGDNFAAIASLVATLQPDTIIHMAAVHAEPPTFDEMMGMLNCSLLLGVGLLQGAAGCANSPTFIHAGTYWQFDGDAYAPNTFYAAAKQALHDLLSYYHRVHSIRSTTLVLYDIYGPDDTRPKLWNKLMLAPRGSVFPVSEGRQLIEAVHVTDIASAFVEASRLLLEGVELERFHAVRSGVRITLRQLLEQVHDRAGLDLTFDWGAIQYWPGQIFEPWQGPLLPGWQARIHPVDGITALVSGEEPTGVGE